MDDNSAPLPVKEPSAEWIGSNAPDAPRAKWPNNCTECGAPFGQERFCPACETFLPDPYVGRLASSKRRLVAAWLDSTFRDGGVFGFAAWSAIVPPGLARTLMVAMAGAYAIGSLYLWSKGTTPAKRVLGMYVVTEDGEPAGFFRMAKRETIGKWISFACLGLGILAIPFDRERQGWHDKMMKTWVIRETDD